MSVLSVKERAQYLHFDEAQCREAGRALAEQYQNAEPFPHIVIDDLIEPDLLRSLLPDFPATDGKTYFDRSQERLKWQFTPDEVPGGRLRNLLIELNNRALLAFLEEMTGIEGLIPDPYYAGGGLHETKRGGHLGIHADFNIHKKMKLQRRLNLLIYLNDDWADDYGGKLELWDREMKGCEVSVAPIIGRAVVFNTDLDSFHGHPDPLTCPPERARRSIATYYYTASEDGLKNLPDRTTNFRQRPQSADQADWYVRGLHFMRDWVPPALARALRSGKH